MRIRPLFVAAALSAVTACGARGDSQQRTPASEAASRGSAAAGECAVLTAADVKAATGVEVRPVARMSSPGAGGTCGNYARPDGSLYLGVNALRSAREFDLAVSSVPSDVYPEKESIAGLGDEGILFTGERGLYLYLVARKGSRGVVLFGLGGNGGLSADQLRRLAERALAAR